MKQTRIIGVAVVSLCCFAATSQANLIINGDFETGVIGPSTSGYSLDNTAGGLASGGEGSGAGEYSLVTDPNFSHSGFISAADHTPTGPGYMMVVNASLSAGKTVWSQTVAPPLDTSGATPYLFSAWVMNVYADSPARLEFTFGGVNLGTFSATGVGVWQKFTATFVPVNSVGGVIDLNLAFQGNDFALDDISLVAVPEPTTVIAGALLLLPFGASTFRILRKNRAA